MGAARLVLEGKVHEQFIQQPAQGLVGRHVIPNAVKPAQAHEQPALVIVPIPRQQGPSR